MANNSKEEPIEKQLWKAADKLASGAYLYVLRTTNFTQIKKMQLMK